MKIFVAGIATETNTFSPLPTCLSDFSIARNLEDTASVNCGGVTKIARRIAENGDQLVHSLLAYAGPAGKTIRSAYESMRDEILDDLRTHQDAEIVLLLLHGAMVADGYDDCEADLVTCCRAIVGDKKVIGVELDLHGHIDENLLNAATIVKSYKEYPHIDISDVAIELYDACRKAALSEISPVMALADCKMVGMFSTAREPMVQFVREMKEAEAEDGVIAVSFNHGFPWGDVPHMGAKMLVVTDAEPERAQELADRFSRRIYELRESAKLKSTFWLEALPQAVASRNRPTIVADQSDNAGGGAPSDSTYVLQWLIENKVRNAGIAFLYDPEVVKIAFAVGEGAELAVRLGGKTCPESGMPIDLRVRVLATRRGYMHDFPQQGGGKLMVPAGDTVALASDGIYVIVNSIRTQCFSPTAFYDFGLDDLDIYIPKSTNHFMSGFAPIAGEVIMMTAPGAIMPVFTEIEYCNFDTRGKWPWHEA
jgi:microcystin degradation protein MlrC